MNVCSDAKNILKRKWKQDKLEQLIFILFNGWCALPVLLSLYCLIMGATGSFHLDQEEQNYSYSYLVTIDTYRIAFRVLGVITIIFALAIICDSFESILDFKRFRTRSWFYLLAGLLLWSFLCTALSDLPIEQLWGYDLNCDGFFSYLVYAALFICGSLLSSEIFRRRLILVFCGVMVYLSVILFAQETGNPFIHYCFPTNKASIFYNTNYFGYVLCLSVVILFALYLFDEEASNKRKCIYLLLFTEQLITLLVNDTFGCFLAVLASLPIAYLVYSKRGRELGFAEFIPAIIFIVFSLFHYVFKNADFIRLFSDISDIVANTDDAGHAGSGRWAYWVDAVHRIAERPIFGFGPEGFYYDYRYITSGPPHNEFLQLIGYLGFPGAILYFLAAAKLAIHLWKNRNELSTSTLVGAMAVVCFFASDFFGHPVFCTTPYFWIIYGLITIDNEFSQPFLSFAAEDENGKRKRIVCIILAVYFAVCICIAAHNFTDRNENINEVSDLLAMRNAEVSVQLKIFNGSLTGYSEFWYDADSFALIPIDEPPPNPCGCGTSKPGGGIKAYLEKYDSVYEYDESYDYRDSVIRVQVDPSSSAINIESRYIIDSAQSV